MPATPPLRTGSSSWTSFATRARRALVVRRRLGNLASDEAQWQFAPYTEQDLQHRSTRPKLYGDAGRRWSTDLQQLRGRDQRLRQSGAVRTRADALRVQATGQAPGAWKPTDVIATASLIGGIFGKGGGNELDSALTLQAFVSRFGRHRGRRAWRDFREKNDPAAPTTVEQRFPYETDEPIRQARPRAAGSGLGASAPVGPPTSSASDRRRRPGDSRTRAPSFAARHAARVQLGAGLRPTLEDRATRSPCRARRSATTTRRSSWRRTLHGPGVDARGGAFPGVNLYV